MGTVGSAGVSEGVDAGGAVLAQDPGALARRGARRDDVVEDGDGGALQGRTPVAEGAGDVLTALARAQADLAGGRAHAFEASRGRLDAKAVEEDLGLVESPRELTTAVEGDGEDGVRGERVDGSERFGHAGGEVADAAELEAVHDATGGPRHLEGGAGAIKVTPTAAVAAAPFVLDPNATAGAAPGAARGHEPAHAVFAQVVAKGSAGDTARGVEQVEGAGEEGGHRRAG